MIKFKFLLFFLIFAKIICVILASTHWIVTDEGLIEPILDSPFHMRMSNDLLSFLEQDKRLVEIFNIYETLSQRNLIFDKSEGSYNLAPESYKNNEHCIKSLPNINNVDIFMSIAADGSDREGVSLQDFFAEESLRNMHGSEIPNCDDLSSLKFSMTSFEHLKAMKERQNLSIAAERSLHAWLLPGTSEESFGHQVSLGLLHNSSSWLHYNLAAIYWRITGNALKAVECSRRAVYFAPRQYRDIALLNMGSILHQTKSFVDAAVILHAAVDHNPKVAANHFALGNVYAALEEFEKSAACYDNVLDLKPSFKQAIINKHQVLCQEYQLKELMQLHDTIQEKRAKLNEFQDLLDKGHQLIAKTLNLQAPLDVKILDYVDIVDKIPGDSLELHFDKQMAKYTFVQNYDILSNYLFNPVELHGNIKKMLKSLETEAKKISKQTVLTDDYFLVKNAPQLEYQISVRRIRQSSPVNNVETEDDVGIINSPLKLYINDFREFSPELDKQIEVDFEESRKKLPVKYPKDTMKVSRVLLDFDNDPKWPSMEDCDVWSSSFMKIVNKDGDLLESLPVYLPIENKGYNAKALLSEDVPLNVEHSLPWYPPVCCSSVDLPIRSEYLPLGLRVKPKLLPKLPEDNILRDILISYATCETKKQIQEAEIGHRIHTAMKMRYAPKWVLYTLASLYWRVRKNVQNALDCLLCAIDTSPNDVKDAPLTSLTSVLHELGYVDEAFKVASKAYNINRFEPATNFVISLIQKSSNQVLGQMFHMKQVLRVDQTFMNGIAYTLIRAWHCNIKFYDIVKEFNDNIEVKLQLEKIPRIVTEDILGTEVLDPRFMTMDGFLLEVVCTSDGQVCLPINVKIFDRETDTQFFPCQNWNLNAMEIPDESLIDNIFYIYDDFTPTLRILINVGCTKKVIRIFVPLVKDDDVTIESRDKNVVSKYDLMYDDTYVIDKYGYRQELGKFTLSVRKPKESILAQEWELLIQDKNIRLSLFESSCPEKKNIQDIFLHKSIWALFRSRFPTLNQLLADYKVTEPYSKPVCNAITSKNKLSSWYMKISTETMEPSDKVQTLLRNLMGGTNATLDEIGTMIAKAVSNNEESWILRFLSGVYWTAEGNIGLAVTCMRHAFLLSPEQDRDIPIFAIAALFYWSDNIREALAYTKYAYEIHPDFAFGPFFLGYIYANTDKNDDSLSMFRRSMVMFRKSIAIDHEFSAAEDGILRMICNMLVHGDLKQIIQQQTDFNAI